MDFSSFQSFRSFEQKCDNKNKEIYNKANQCFKVSDTLLSELECDKNYTSDIHELAKYKENTINEATKILPIIINEMDLNKNKPFCLQFQRHINNPVVVGVLGDMNLSVHNWESGGDEIPYVNICNKEAKEIDDERKKSYTNYKYETKFLS